MVSLVMRNGFRPSTVTSPASAAFGSPQGVQEVLAQLLQVGRPRPWGDEVGRHLVAPAAAAPLSNGERKRGDGDGDGVGGGVGWGVIHRGASKWCPVQIREEGP